MNIPLRRRLSFSVILACLTTALCADATAQSSPGASSPYRKEASEGIGTLQGWYNASTGLYQTTGWWNSANAITVLADYSRTAKTQRYVPVLANTFSKAPAANAGFLNNYYDDEGWWALAWIDAYDLTRSPQYLHMAEAIFADMAGGWDTTTCGGGIWWSKDKTYKNAIANELFLSVAAHLANRTSESLRAQYANWSKREWEWFLASGMINEQNLVNDGLNPSSPAACKNNGQATWSYNQGVILGGLAEFSRFSNDRSLIPQAARIASAAITHLTDSKGILHDPCEPNCGADGPQFKGIFVRNLARLHAEAPTAAYKSFAEANANSIWSKDQGANHSFGLVWSGPFDSGDAARQSSALDAMVAAATMEQAH